MSNTLNIISGVYRVAQMSDRLARPNRAKRRLTFSLMARKETVVAIGTTACVGQVEIRLNLETVSGIREIGDYLSFDWVDPWDPTQVPVISIRDYRQATKDFYRRYRQWNLHSKLSFRHQKGFESLQAVFNSQAPMEIVRHNYTFIISLREPEQRRPAQAMLSMYTFYGDAYSYGLGFGYDYEVKNAIHYEIVENNPIWNWSSLALTPEQINDAEIMWFTLTDDLHRVVIVEASTAPPHRKVQLVKGITESTVRI